MAFPSLAIASLRLFIDTSVCAMYILIMIGDLCSLHTIAVMLQAPKPPAPERSAMCHNDT